MRNSVSSIAAKQGARMEIDEIELRNALMKANANIGKGVVTTVLLRAPLTVEAATALGCRDILFSTDGEVRPGLFVSSVLGLSCEPVTVQLALDGIAKREIKVENASAGPFTIEQEEGCLRLTVKLIIRGPFRPQLGLLGFAMEVGEAPLICRLVSSNGLQKGFGGDVGEEADA
jgi:hypothetical protein